jgi:pimeloyl-ACP methyl ester carboxylesterase
MPPRTKPRPPKPTQAPQNRFANVNGVRLHCLVAGTGDPVVLLHGYAETSHMWRPLMADLANTHTVIAPDLRGAGQSSTPPSGYTKFASFAQTPLPMPMLVLTGEKASGDFLIQQGRLVATNVEGVVVRNSGHWLMEEAPDQVIPRIVEFLDRH